MNRNYLMMRLAAVCALLIGGMFVSGCGGTKEKFAELPNGAVTGPMLSGGTSEILHVGDLLTISFSDVVTPILPWEGTIKEDGTITLMLNQTFVAAGKTRRDLEKELRTRYVPKYFANLTATIKPQNLFYFVGGEVRAPNRYVYVGPITVTRAIQSAGDFTDFANKTAVKVIRADGRTETVNCKKAIGRPELDREVFPGDKIHVNRAWW